MNDSLILERLVSEFSLTPNFSWVEEMILETGNRFNGFRNCTRTVRKPLKRFTGRRPFYTQLKLGVNERMLKPSGARFETPPFFIFHFSFFIHP